MVLELGETEMNESFKFTKSAVEVFELLKKCHTWIEER